VIETTGYDARTHSFQPEEKRINQEGTQTTGYVLAACGLGSIFLKLEASPPSETHVNIYHTTRRHNPED
jgi:hypothetical protein